jgi:hypothetical protein
MKTTGWSYLGHLKCQDTSTAWEHSPQYKQEMEMDVQTRWRPMQIRGMDTQRLDGLLDRTNLEENTQQEDEFNPT